MKYKNFIIHVCLLVAFALQIILVITDLKDYGFLSAQYITISDVLIILRFAIFLPFCVYEAYLSAKYKYLAEQEDEEESGKYRKYGRRRCYSKFFGVTQVNTNSNRMDEEYSRRTQFMDKAELLRKKEEMRGK